ncbi:hypothetical protein F511_37445 [Dorcoceras hygrometricum]|uniref:Dystroglycan-like n=1 Tax=Dorcoceras hygrometricum TaxID=472368 RepID=A0A2Z7CMC6_9LAMI|nr:hypothetical protein F511_37445 [Dorcoceras hygrometricum]
MEFLGCPAIFHENALTEFFANGSVRDGMVVSTIGGIAVEISESVFAATFGLPTEGLTDLSEVPRNLLSDAQSLFSVSEKEVSISCLKKEIKMQYRLLSEILAKSLFVKAGSFDAVTRDRLLLMTAITFDVKVNWGNLLFGVLREMVTPDSRQAKGYAIQICDVLKNIPGLELSESKAFPAPRILNEKTEEVGEAPREKKTPVKKTLSKKRQAAVEGVATGEQIPVVGVATGEQIPATEDADATIKQVLDQLDLVFEEPDAAQGGLVKTWFDKAFDEEFELANSERQDTEEEIVVGFEKGTSAGDQLPAFKNGADETNDDESLSIEEHQARIPFHASLPSTLAPPITQIRFGQGIEFRDVDAYTPNLPRIDISDKGKLRKLASLQSEDIFAKEGQLISWVEKDSSFVAIQRRQFIIAKYRELLLRKFIDARRKNFVSEPVQDIDSRPSLSRALRVVWAEICMEAIQFSTVGCLRPVCRELVVYNLGVERIPDYLLTNFEKGVHTDCFVGYFDDSCVQPSIQTSSGIESYSSSASTVCRSPSPILQEVNSPDFEPVAPTDDQEDIHTSLPTASVDFVSLLDALQASLCQRMDDANNDIISRLHSTERSVQTSLGHQTDYLRRLIESAQQAGQTQDDIQLLRLNELRKFVMAIDIKVGTDSLDVRNKFSSIDAKLRSFDDQIATIRNDQLEFQTKIAADILGLSTQISEIAEYIRSGDAKKGESGSSSRPPPVRVERRPLPTPQSPRDVVGGSSAVRIPTFPRTTELLQNELNRRGDTY